jgi:phosphoglycolate phosphatase-like HAD superfamily hydrolase
VTVPNPLFLVSFDIDGTLETGDPPGPLLVDFARRAKALGYIVGSSSDRTLTEQTVMWGKAGFEVDFVCRKHEMIALVSQFAADKYVHIGDTTHDEDSALRAGFEFIFTHEAALLGENPWLRPPAA